MIKIKVKPLSLNHAYSGRRFSTPQLEDFKLEVMLLAPKIKVPEGKLSVKYVFGVSTKNADGDNLIKCFQDSIAEIYGFNDKQIYKWQVEKIDVKKGQEYISFEINKV